jgi:AcrR family transcriptional regulator
LATELEFPREERNNRERLLQAAATAFAEQGYEGASLRAIAASADVSFQLIAHYFGNKEDLWRATVDYYYERYLEMGKGLGFTQSGNVFEQFRNHLRLLLTDMMQRPELRKMWINEHLAGGPRYEQIIKPKVKHLLETLSMPYFEEVVRRGIVTRYEAWEVALLWTAINQANVVYPYYIELLLGAPSGSRKSIERQVDFLFRLMTEDDTSGLGDGGDALAGGSALGRRLSELEAENEQLRRLVTTLSLEKQGLLDSLSKRD